MVCVRKVRLQLVSLDEILNLFDFILPKHLLIFILCRAAKKYHCLHLECQITGCSVIMQKATSRNW